MFIRRRIQSYFFLSIRVMASPLVVIAVMALLLVPKALAQNVLQPGDQPPDSPPQAGANGDGTKFILQFTKATPRSARAQIVQQAGASVRNDLSVIDALAVTVPNQNVLNALMNNHNVRRVVPDRVLREAMPPPVTPPPPTLLTANGVSSSQIDFTWNEGAGSSEEGFRVERCGGSCADFTERATVGPNVFNYSDTGLGPGETYTYRVIAFITGGPPENRSSDTFDYLGGNDTGGRRRAKARRLTCPPQPFPTAKSTSPGRTTRVMRTSSSLSDAARFRLARLSRRSIRSGPVSRTIVTWV